MWTPIVASLMSVKDFEKRFSSLVSLTYNFTAAVAQESLRRKIYVTATR